MRNYMAERSPNEPKISLSIAFRGMSEKGKYLSFKIVVRDAHIQALGAQGMSTLKEGTGRNLITV